MSREELVRTAIEVLDESGLSGLTLRQVATRLGVQAPALYWYVRNKRELLDLMAEAMVLGALPPELQQPAADQPWWEWLADRALAFWHALMTHPDSALVLAGNRPTWSSLPHIEGQLTVLVRAGFPPGEALQVMLALGTLVTGSLLEEQASASRPVEGDERGRALRHELSTGTRFPTLAAATRDGPPDGTLVFEYSLRLMIDGLRSRHARLTAPAAGKPASRGRQPKPRP